MPATSVAPHSTTLTARRSTSDGMRRSNASISLRPRASAIAARNSTASVVTLIPPAVDADPPPMNISMSVTSWLEPSSAPMSSVANPPDRAIDEMKKLCRIRWPTSMSAMVRSLLNSSTK